MSSQPSLHGDFSVTDVLERAWAALKEQIALAGGLTLVVTVATYTLHFIPILGTMLAAPLLGGYYICLQKIGKKEPFGFADFFWGYADLTRMIHFVLISLFTTLAVGIGLILLIVPGIYIMVAISFSTVSMVLENSDAISAIRRSFEIVQGRWWKFAWLSLALIFINALGLLALFVGVFFTAPLTAYAILLIAQDSIQHLKSNPALPTPPQDPPVYT